MYAERPVINVVTWYVRLYEHLQKNSLYVQISMLQLLQKHEYRSSSTDPARSF